MFGRLTSVVPSKAIFVKILKAGGNVGLKLSHFLTMSVLTGALLHNFMSSRIKVIFYFPGVAL